MIGGSARIYDSASPVTLAEHDRIVFLVPPQRLRLARSGDHLVLCSDADRLEVVIDNQYCRGPGVLTDTDTPNNEVEQIVFTKTREIWLTDLLYGQLRKPAGRGYALVDQPPGGGFEAADTAGRKPWRVRPFSAVLPNWKRQAGACQQP